MPTPSSPFAVPAGRKVRDLPAKPPRPHDFDTWPRRFVEIARPDGKGTLSLCVHELGEGPPLLLVHGLMTSAYSFRYVARRLAARHRVIVPDLPGAGRSEVPADLPADPETFAAILASLLDVVVEEPVYVVGNSLGGYLSLWLAALHPEKLARLLVMHAPGVPEPRLYALAGLGRLRPALAIARRVMQRDPERFALANVHYRDESIKSREETAEYGRIFHDDARTDFFLRILVDGLAPGPMRHLGRLLRGIPVPLRLLYAREDPMVDPAIGPKLHAQLPQADLVWMTDTSHFMHVDTPEATLREIEAFEGLAAPDATEGR